MKLNICFREVKHGKFKGDIDCVLLDFRGTHHGDDIQCYAKIGQHGFGDYSYFRYNTKTAKNYQDLLKEIQSIYHDYEIIVHNRLTRNFLEEQK